MIWYMDKGFESRNYIVRCFLRMIFLSIIGKNIVIVGIRIFFS